MAMSQQDEERLQEESLEQVQETLDKGDEDEDEEKLFEELEKDDDSVIANLRERRMEQLKQEYASEKL
ncbi:4488_t:CDS:2 [Racocetra fulgida]|uniref:4488_t:CDS:1 n=1 Tax=Racocetra fulgida TaxID=60492 RepID=A0A9N8ZF80_9GLOM|nr:4488_t:CDS:2 [Racocetra fulgida]